MRRLVVKRSWSHCSEMLRYIRTFFHLFYEHGYGDGFLKGLNRFDVEKYIEWVADDYEGDNATYASKAVSFVREFLDYIQMAEYPEARTGTYIPSFSVMMFPNGSVLKIHMRRSGISRNRSVYSWTPM